MADAARVTSIQAIKDFRGAYIAFADDATSALGEAEADIVRTILWLRHDQSAYWRRQCAVLDEKVRAAKAELLRKELSSHEGASHVLEKRAITKAKARLEAAHDKLALTKKWLRILEREMEIYKGEVNRLASLVQSDAPAAAAKLGKMIERLEQYASTRKRPARVEGEAFAAIIADPANASPPASQKEPDE